MKVSELYLFELAAESVPRRSLAEVVDVRQFELDAGSAWHQLPEVVVKVGDSCPPGLVAGYRPAS